MIFVSWRVSVSVFSVFTDRKKRKKNTETPTVEQYYEKRARHISHIRYACLLLTVLFGVYGFVVHGQELTADNFRYMLKFLDLEEAEVTDENAELRFDYAESNQGGLYLGDLVVLNTDGLTVYSRDAGTAGDKLFSESFRMEDPRLAITPKYVFAYDLGGNEIRVFNSHSQFAKLSMDYPIYGFSAADNGSFAVITAEKNYRTAVYVYDSYARQVYKRLLSNTYMDQISLSPDGQSFLALGHEAGDGYLRTLLQVYSIKAEQPVTSVSYRGELPLMAAYTENGKFAVLTGSALRFFDGTGDTPVEVHSIEGQSLLGYSFSSGQILLSVEGSGLSGGSRLLVYNAGGKLVGETAFRGRTTHTLIQNDLLYLLNSDTLTVFTLEGETQVYKTRGDALQVLFDLDGTPIIFEKNVAYRLSDTQKEDTQ